MVFRPEALFKIPGRLSASAQSSGLCGLMNLRALRVLWA